MITIWSKPNCPNCEKAIQLAEKYNIMYEVRKIGNGWSKEQLLEQVPTARSVPQILKSDGDIIGGLSEFMNFLKGG